MPVRSLNLDSRLSSEVVELEAKAFLASMISGLPSILDPAR
jgi:hypothetical protein